MKGKKSQKTPDVRICLTKRFEFSASHRYWNPAWSEEENRRVFGKCVSPYGHGHNYLLEVTVTGPVNSETGMILNVTELKNLVNRVLEEFDHRFLNEETPYFKNIQPTTENLCKVLYQKIEKRLPSSISLYRLKLYETDDLYVEYYGEGKEGIEEQGKGGRGSSGVRLTRRYRFSAAHRLWAPHLSSAQNFRIFGKCGREKGHGHDYILEATIDASPSQNTGMGVPYNSLDSLIQKVLQELDHKRLDVEVPFFQTHNPTGEYIIDYLFQRIKKALPSISKASGSKIVLRRILLWETRSIYFESLPKV